MSPQALIEDFKRDWPHWRAILPELPSLLKRALEEPQPSKPSPERQLPKAGIGIALAGTIGTLLSQQDFVSDPLIAETSPWIVLAGIILIIFRR